MERLTKRDKDGNTYLRDGSFVSYIMSIKKLAEYEELEEQGLLLRLPCKVGSELYFVHKCPAYEKVDGKLVPTEFYEIRDLKFIVLLIDYIGKTLFLTREEAEEELRKMKKEA